MASPTTFENFIFPLFTVSHLKLLKITSLYCRYNEIILKLVTALKKLTLNYCVVLFDKYQCLRNRNSENQYNDNNFEIQQKIPMQFHIHSFWRNGRQHTPSGHEGHPSHFSKIEGALCKTSTGTTKKCSKLISKSLVKVKINQFQVNFRSNKFQVPFLHPLKAPQIRSHFGVFRVYRNGTLVWNGLK